MADKCVSAGIVFRRVCHGVDEVLLLQSRGRREWWSDIGGRRESRDASIRETAIREVVEETNRRFDAATIRRWIGGNIPYIARAGSYAIYQVYCPRQDPMPPSYFGETEEGHPLELQREIRWIPTRVFCSLPVEQVHPRIRHYWNRLRREYMLGDRGTYDHRSSSVTDLLPGAHTRLRVSSRPQSATRLNASLGAPTIRSAREASFANPVRYAPVPTLTPP